MYEVYDATNPQFRVEPKSSQPLCGDAEIYPATQSYASTCWASQKADTAVKVLEVISRQPLQLT